MEAMWARLRDPGSYQALQYFITEADWHAEGLWRRLRVAIPAREGMLVLDGTGFPKQGRASVGVSRQYSGTWGKIGNCPVAVTAALWTGVQAWVVGTRLYLPATWLTPDGPRSPGLAAASRAGHHADQRPRVGGADRRPQMADGQLAQWHARPVANPVLGVSSDPRARLADTPRRPGDLAALSARPRRHAPTFPQARAAITDILTAHYFLTHRRHLNMLLQLAEIPLRTQQSRTSSSAPTPQEPRRVQLGQARLTHAAQTRPPEGPRGCGGGPARGQDTRALASETG